MHFEFRFAALMIINQFTQELIYFSNVFANKCIYKYNVDFAGAYIGIGIACLVVAVAVVAVVAIVRYRTRTRR